MEKKYGKPSEDLAHVKLGDTRLDSRLRKTVDAMTENTGSSILGVCGTRHDAKAFYALLSSKKFNRELISDAAGQATVSRIRSYGIPEVLLPQDTTDINLNGHEKTEGLGYSSNQTKGVKVHSCLALTPDGTPVGLLMQQYQTRESAKQSAPKSELKKRPIEEKESYRWLETVRGCLALLPENVKGIVICDREGDFYELYAEMQALDASFVVRVTQDRLTECDLRSIQQLRQTPACGTVETTISRNSRKNTPERQAALEVAYCTVKIKRPKYASSTTPPNLEMTLLRVTETNAEVEPIEWILATNISVQDADSALKAVEYYAHRWKIERFHYILKSGCQAEKIQQRTYEKILAVLLIYSIISAFILAMTYFARNEPNAPCDQFFGEHEWKILYRLVTRNKTPPSKPYSLKTAVEYLGELGSFKHSPSDGPYGVKALWLGLSKLFDAIDFADRLMGQG